MSSDGGHLRSDMTLRRRAIDHCTPLGKEVNEAIDRVGRVLYGEMWIGEVSSADWEMWNSYGMPDANPARLPTPARGAACHAQARLRSLITYVGGPQYRTKELAPAAEVSQ
jgi:hypothetical protein